MVRRYVVAFLAVLATVGTVAACTKSSPTTTVTQTTNSTITRSPSSGSTGPITTVPVIAKTVASCPYLSKASAAQKAGMRLEKITELRRGGKVVGCRFYALEHPGDGCDETCLAKEKLPPANQPAIEILSTGYGTPTDAHNAFVQLAEKGKTIEQEPIGSGNIGLCFQTDYYAHDHGTDWACAFSKGSTMVLVRTVVTSPADDVVEIAQAIYGKF